MGTCASRESGISNKSNAKQDNPDEFSSYGIRENMVRRSRNQNVFQFYEIVRTIGAGSMGSVSEVRAKFNIMPQQQPQEKASPFLARIRRGGAKVGKSSNDDDADKRRTYALKHIMLDRVTSTFLDELRNEIEILKKLDRKCETPKELSLLI